MFEIIRQNIKTGAVTVPVKPADSSGLEPAGNELKAKIRKLLGGGSLNIRLVDAGSCNGCELETGMLGSPVYDIERFGVHFVASPRHADILLVTGPVTRQMETALRKTYEAVPEPKIVIACGDCARDCGVFAGSYAVAGPVESIIPVDLKIPGCPPNPMTIIQALQSPI